jgi:hypothetical protein
MCSMILLALNTFMATPGCVTADGPATVAAQRWGAYELSFTASHQTLPLYGRKDGALFAGAYESGTDQFVGFTYFPDSMTLVLSTELP